jgi:membrane protease YdiL (CAAX protease family)
MILMPSKSRSRTWILSGAVVLALLGLEVLGGWTYGLVVTAGMLVIGLMFRLIDPAGRLVWWRPDRGDLIAIAAMYLGVVGAIRLAFVGFTTDSMVGLFVSYAVVGLLALGVAGPVVYSVWFRSRSLRSLGIGLHQWRLTIGLALVFAATQFALTLWGYDLPEPVDWVPLLLMSLTVGVFESIFFRGFVQNRLEKSFGPVAGIGVAAVLYGLYHVGYGMGAAEVAFLTGLGVVYAVAFSTTRNVLVLWPLLTPLGSFFNNLEGGNIELPWASMIGFGEVMLAMVVVLWLAHRREVRGTLIRRQPVATGDFPPVAREKTPLQLR